VLSKRQPVIEFIEEQFETVFIVHLFGDVATGKTSIAYLLAEHHKGSKYWLDVSGVTFEGLPGYILQNFESELKLAPNNNVSDALDAIFTGLAADSLIVVNELPELVANGLTVRFLNEFIASAISNGQTVVFTSNHRLPAALEQEYTGQLFSLQIPPMDSDEVAEVLLSLGANQENADGLKTIVHSLTEGHPLIVSTVAHYLKEMGWSNEPVLLESLFKDQYGNLLNQEIYNRLLDTTADEQTRDLLYRLKLVIGSFSQEEIDTLSNVKPAIAHAGEKISRVTDIWLQITQDRRFRLSPLIKRLPQNLTDKQKAALYVKLAKQLLSKKILSPFDAARVIQYYQNAGKLADSAMVLLKVLYKFYDHPDLFFQNGFGLYWYLWRLPDEVPPFIKINIRVLQIHFAQSQNHEINFLKQDLTELRNTPALSDIVRGFADLALFRLNVTENPVAALQNAIDVNRELFAGGISEEIFDKEKELMLKGIWVTFYQLQADDYARWFEMAKLLALSDEYLDPQTNEAYAIAGPTILKNIIREDIEGETGLKIKILKTIYEGSIANSMYLIAAYAVKYMVYLYARIENDFKNARQVVDENEELMSKHNIYRFLVIDEYGRQLFFAERDEEALTELTKIIEIDLPSVYSEKPETFRVFAQLVSKENANLAHHYLLSAIRTVTDNKFNIELEKGSLIW